MMSCIDWLTYVTAKLIVLWSIFCCHSPWNKSVRRRFKSMWWQMGLQCFQIDVCSKQNRGPAALSVEAGCYSHELVMVSLFCSSLPPLPWLVIIIFKNAHGPTSLALFIASVAIILHNSMVSFVCFPLVLLISVQTSKTLQSTAELAGSPSPCCTCGDARCQFPQMLFTSCVAAPWAFSMVESSSARFHTPGDMWTLCSCIC